MTRDFPLWVHQKAYLLHRQGLSCEKIHKELDKECRRRLKRPAPIDRTLDAWAKKDKWKENDRIAAESARKKLLAKLEEAEGKAIEEHAELAGILRSQLLDQLRPSEKGGENIRVSIPVALQHFLMLDKELSRKIREGGSEQDIQELLNQILEPLFDILKDVLGDVFGENRTEILKRLHLVLRNMEQGNAHR